MKRIWNWFMSFFRRRKEKAVEKEIRDLEEERWASPRAFKNIVRFFSGQWRPVGGINMPKYLPCPDCGKRSKRARKIAAGAKYFCRRHRVEFTVMNRRAQEALHRELTRKLPAGAI